MNESTKETTITTPDTVATVDDMPQLDSPASQIGQEAIDAAFAEEQEKELQSFLAEAEKAEAGTDGGTTQENPPPDTTGEPAKETPEPAPAATDTGKPGNAEPVPPANDLEARLAQARLEGERAAAGRYGGEKQSMMRRIAELEAQVAAGGTAKPAAAKDGGGEYEPTEEDFKQYLGDNWKEEWGEDGAKAELRRQFRMASRVAKSLVDDEIHKQLSAERQAAAIARFEGDLEAAVPGAMDLIGKRETNGLDAFLDAPFEGTSVTRRTVVSAAIDQVEGGATGEEYRRALETVSRTLKGYAESRRGQTTTKAPATLAPAINPEQYATTAAARGAAGASTSRGKGAPTKLYSDAQIKQYLDKASEKGPEAYERAQAWATEQYNKGTVSD